MNNMAEAKSKDDAAAAPDELQFDRAAHVTYYKMHLSLIRSEYETMDSNRLALMYFTLSGLDILGVLDEHVDKKAVIEWIYAQQVPPPRKGEVNKCGFRPGPSSGVPHHPTQKDEVDVTPAASTSSPATTATQGDASPPPSHQTSSQAPSSSTSARSNPALNLSAPSDSARQSADTWPHDGGHIAMTYTALCMLKILGDDLSRVHKKSIVASLRNLQCEDGSFTPVCGGQENDMRFIFCACVISHMLDDFSGFDVEKTVQYIVRSQTYDGAFGLRPLEEGHGGSTFCAIAALTLLNRQDAIRDREGLVRWCMQRQGRGFSGRPNKPPDTCYSYWLGATMKMLGIYHMTRPGKNRKFNLKCQPSMGGFGKVPKVYSDLLHSYMGLCGLSLMDKGDNLKEIDPVYGFSKVAGGRKIPEGVAA